MLYRRARMADLDGFSALFDKFVTQPGSSVDWDKIEKLPANSVRTKNICSIIEKYYLLYHRFCGTVTWPAAASCLLVISRRC